MNYATSILKGKYNVPTAKFDENGSKVYTSMDQYLINVLNVEVQSKIKDKQDVMVLAEQLYPELKRVLGDGQYVGVRVVLDGYEFGFAISANDTFRDFQRSLLRKYTAMKLDANIFGHEREY